MSLDFWRALHMMINQNKTRGLQLHLCKTWVNGWKNTTDWDKALYLTDIVWHSLSWAILIFSFIPQQPTPPHQYHNPAELNWDPTVLF